ncbi:hypothetical protein ACHAP7_002539 [Fusarium lateritium]
MNEPKRPSGRPRREPSPSPLPPATTKRGPGRPRKNPETQPQSSNTTGDQTEPRKRGRPRKTAPEPLSQNDEDYVDEDDQLDQEDAEQLSQEDEEQETVTRRTRSKFSRVSGRPKSSKSRRSTRLDIAQRDRDEKLQAGVSQEKERLKQPRSFMTKEIYEAPGKPGFDGPDLAFGNQWDVGDEVNLILKYWKGTPLEHMTSASSFSTQDKLALVFRASLHVFKVDPLTLFTKGLNELEVDIVSNQKSSMMIDGQPYTNPVWSSPFCDRLARIIHHPLWTGLEKWAFMLFAIKWAAICRTDSRRSLHDDELRLLERHECKMQQDPTLRYADIHAKEQRRIRFLDGDSTPQAQLLSGIAKFSQRNGRPSSHFYQIITGDLTAVIHGLNSLREAFDHDCEFYYQMFAEAHTKELYPKGKEMPALYKNCYLSVERKRLFDFKVHGHDLVYFEEHHLRKPSEIPEKLRAYLSDGEELEKDILPQPSQQDVTGPDANPFEETAPEAANDEGGNENLHDDNAQVFNPLEYEDYVSNTGNLSDSEHGEVAEQHDDESALIFPGISDDEAPQDTARIPATQETGEEHQITRDDSASSPPPFHRRATQSRNDRLDTSPSASVLRGLLSELELGSPTLISRGNLGGGGDQSIASSPVLPPLPPQKTTVSRNRHDQDTAASPNRAPLPMHKPTPTSQDDSEDKDVLGARKRKNNGNDTRPRKVIRRDEVPSCGGVQPTVGEPSSGLTVEEESQPSEQAYKRQVLPDISDAVLGSIANPYATTQEAIVMDRPFIYRSPGREFDEFDE